MPGGARIYAAASGGLWSTPSDLARYAFEVQRSLAGKSNLLSAAIAAKMLTPGMNNRGLGLEIGGTKEHPYFTHGGHTAGFQSMLVAYNAGDGAVVMTNGENGYQLLREILATIAREYKWPDFQPVERHIIKIDPKILDSYASKYEIRPNVFATVTRQGNSLFVQIPLQPKMEFMPMSETKFFLKYSDIDMSFVKNEKGEVVEAVLEGSLNARAKRANEATAGSGQ